MQVPDAALNKVANAEILLLVVGIGDRVRVIFRFL